MPSPLPHILGSDIAGEIVQIGKSVGNLRVGDKVILFPGISCNQCDFCATGLDNICQTHKTIGYQVPGGYAEFVCVPAVNAFPMPENLSFVEAASLPVVFLTAWHMLISRANVKPREQVLILGAGSGVGTAAIQIAKLAGMRVIAVSSDRQKLEKARQLGADELVLAGDPDFGRVVKDACGGRGVDVVFEHLGAFAWAKSLHALAPKGRLVTCGATTGGDVNVELIRLIVNEWSVLGSYLGTRSEFDTILQAVRSGRLAPVVDRIFPLDQAAEAHTYLERGHQFGKVVLRI